MAITTTTISKNVGWAATDVILQLQEAFTWLGWHGDTISGIVTGISAYSGGGTVGSSNTDFYDVSPATTTGIGTGASFAVFRNGGTIQNVYVNRPGVGYTNGEYVTLSAEDIGGSANGATGIGITVLVAGGESPVGYGTTTAFFDSEISGTYPWGVVRHQIEPNKKFGDTYRGFQTLSNTTLYIGGGSSFHPWDTTNTADRGNFYKNRWAGNTGFDISGFSPTSSALEISNTSPVLGNLIYTSFVVANSTSYQLDLNLYRSGIDPNFAVFAYKHPTLSSAILSDNNYAVFFFHNFTTPIWDLDYLFLGGMTRISPETGNTGIPKITFTTHLAASTNQKRSAEWGYSSSGSSTIKSTQYESSIYPQSSIDEISFYTRTAGNSTGGDSNSETLNSNTFYNAVIKGIPLSAQMAPCPYYLPDDFVLIDFQINTPSVNVQQGDTITISGSEVYTVITASYNQTTTTRGMAFCARTV
jgi:hypothetical protein